MKVTGIDAIYYTVSDLDAMTAFYADLIGHAPQGSVPGMFSEWAFDDENAFGLYRTSGTGDPKGRNGSVMLRVADVAQAVADAKARGVRFEVDGDITDTPYCHMAFGYDPEGNQFILHHRKTG
jgi:predicted enzyme related to lactoylglutathione lyase